VVPTFFWGGSGRQGDQHCCIADRLNLMGVWHDPSQP
jgi:hypothetical protein